jgi:N-acetylglucosaminyl-diphospho-decaprenol L-rhamnosyltransferase
MGISLITVNFHGADEVAEMAATVADQVDEIVVVDHSESEAETQRLDGIAGIRSVAQRNLGYGAGLNRGVEEAAHDLFVLCNPDVRPKPGVIETLADHAVRPGVGAVGPTLIWDDNHVWRLPQAPHVTWRSEWEGARRPATARRRNARHQMRLWSHEGALRVPVLSGTFLVTTRRAMDASGGFDPAYFLFYEENDWCRRLERSGLGNLVVPHALVRHEVGISASAEGAEHLDASYRRYRRRWFPRWFTWLHPEPMTPTTDPIPERAVGDPADGARWVVAPTPAFVPIALGPPVASCPAFPPGLPDRIVDQWFAGWMAGEEIVNLGRARNVVGSR